MGKRGKVTYLTACTVTSRLSLTDVSGTHKGISLPSRAWGLGGAVLVDLGMASSKALHLCFSLGFALCFAGCREDFLLPVLIPIVSSHPSRLQEPTLQTWCL